MKFKRIMAILLAAVITVVSMNVFVCAQEGLPFEDVGKTDWFYGDVGLAYEMGLINGRSETTFAPNEMLTHAEAIKLAACMHQVYVDDPPFVVQYDPWYQIYVEYCYEKGIINREYNWSQPITRGAYMDIFSRALPAEALPEINTVEDGLIPDVPMTYRYANSIYALYRAGIVQGIDEMHRCSPDTYVKRSEVAAILTRMMFNDSRLTFNIRHEMDEEEIPTVIYPWEIQGAKQPIYYTLDEYYTLTYEEQQAFIDWFPTKNAYYDWLNSALDVDETPVVTYPWDKFGAKQPDAYTLSEFETLAYDEQQAFINWFPTQAAFIRWFEKASKATEVKYEDKTEDETPPANYPWKEIGAKQPVEYTWEEYDGLTIEQQEKFFEWFDSAEAFEAWKNQVQGNGTVITEKYPWEEGGKKPSEYSWDEFQNLSEYEQEAFFEWFDSAETFETWMNKAQGNDTDTTEKYPWENGGKKPSEYSWNEFQNLSEYEQEAFFEWFSSTEAFETWMNQVQ